MPTGAYARSSRKEKDDDLPRWEASTTSRTSRVFGVRKRTLFWVALVALILYTQSGRITGPRPETSWPWLRDARKPGSLVYAPHRAVDVQDTFRVDGFRQMQNCSQNALMLHEPFEPLCKNKQDLLEAMSSGGRSGQDMPYMPRGCDMRWFNTKEICDIMSRFEQIHVIGDSLMLQLTVALHIFLRRDLVDGGRLAWMGNPEGVDCQCSGTFNSSKCGWYSPVSSDLVWADDPESMACPRDNSAKIDMSVVLNYPLKDAAFERPLSMIPQEKPKKPHAFVIGHGLWNNCSIPLSMNWVNQVEERFTGHAPWLKEPSNWKKLFITPNAAGLNKPQKYLAKQGNVALRKWELGMRDWVIEEHNYDFLGMWNATIQNSSPDGTHAGMRGTLLKAMMVLNWLNSLDLRDW